MSIVQYGFYINPDSYIVTIHFIVYIYKYSLHLYASLLGIIVLVGFGKLIVK